MIKDADIPTAVKIPIPPFLVSKGRPLKDPLPVEVQRNNKMKDSSSFSNYKYYDNDARLLSQFLRCSLLIISLLAYLLRSQPSQLSGSIASSNQSTGSSIAAFRKMYIESLVPKSKPNVTVVTSKNIPESMNETVSTTSPSSINKNSAYYNLVMGKNTATQLPAAATSATRQTSVSSIQEKKKVEFDTESINSIKSGVTSVSPSVVSHASPSGSGTFRPMPTSFNLKNKSPCGNCLPTQCLLTQSYSLNRTRSFRWLLQYNDAW